MTDGDCKLEPERRGEGGPPGEADWVWLTASYDTATLDLFRVAQRVIQVGRVRVCM